MVASPKTPECLRSLEEVVNGTSRKSPWLVMTHDNPDPDALVSAVLLARLLHRAYHRHVDVAYGGIIGRAENQELFRVLKAPFQHARDLTWSDYEHFALVDAQPGTGNSQLPTEITPDVVIDHHPLRKATRSAPFYDVRPDYGATATILTEYLAEAGVEIPRATTTGVIYAIRSETQEFGREAAGPDKAVYDRLLARANKRTLARIQNAPLPLSYFGALQSALENVEGVDTLVISHLGPVPQPDTVPELADLLLRMEGKTWSLVSGVFKERIYLSIRTTNPRADAGRLMRKLVGRRGKGGGHGMLAGGWVAVKPGADPRGIQRQLGARLAKYLKKKPEKIGPIALENGLRPVDEGKAGDGAKGKSGDGAKGTKGTKG